MQRSKQFLPQFSLSRIPQLPDPNLEPAVSQIGKAITRAIAFREPPKTAQTSQATLYGCWMPQEFRFDGHESLRVRFIRLCKSEQHSIQRFDRYYEVPCLRIGFPLGVFGHSKTVLLRYFYELTVRSN